MVNNNDFDDPNKNVSDVFAPGLVLNAMAEKEEEEIAKGERDPKKPRTSNIFFWIMMIFGIVTVIASLVIFFVVTKS